MRTKTKNIDFLEHPNNSHFTQNLILDSVEALQDFHFQQSQAKIYNRQISTNEIQITKDVEPLKRHLSALTLDDSKTWDDLLGDDRLDWISANGSQTSRDSFASRSASELNWSESKNEDKRSSSVCSISSSVFKV